MAPILGIYASQISGHLWAPSGAYESIATTTVGAGGASSITFSSIPSTYTHLQIRFIARDNRGLSYSYLGLRFNGDTGANYRNHYLVGYGSSVGAGSDGGGLTRWPTDGIPGGSATANVFGAGIIDILDYTSTTNNKTLRALVGNDTNGGGSIYFDSGLWYATPSAITSITIVDQSNGEGNFVQYSQFALYGIKG